MIDECRIVNVIPGPYTTLKVNGQAVDMKIDTGADITMVPINVLEAGKFIRQVTLDTGTGRINRADVYEALIEIEAVQFHVEVLATKGPCGYIGLNILKDCYFYLVGGIWELNVL